MGTSSLRLAALAPEKLIRAALRTAGVDGQTLFIDRVSKTKNEAYRIAKAPAGSHTASTTTDEVTLSAAGGSRSPRFVKIEFHVQSLDVSHQFYRDVLQMSCDLREGKLYIGDSLVLSEHRGDSISSAREVILTLAVRNLLETAARLEAIPDLKFSWGRGSDTLWLMDPDGNKIRMIAPVGI